MHGAKADRFRIAIEVAQAARQRARERAAQATSLEPDNVFYPVRTSPSVYEPKVIMRRKRVHVPSDNADSIGTYETLRDTLAAGTNQESLGAHDTLRNLSSMQGTPPPSVPKGRLLSATEISTGMESDTLDRLQVVEREMWKAFKGEVAGENRPSARVRILREISEVQLRQVSVAKHVQRVERAVPVEWERIRDKVLGALGEYPEALAAVMAALEDSE